VLDQALLRGLLLCFGGVGHWGGCALPTTRRVTGDVTLQQGGNGVPVLRIQDALS